MFGFSRILKNPACACACVHVGVCTSVWWLYARRELPLGASVPSFSSWWDTLQSNGRNIDTLCQNKAQAIMIFEEYLKINFNTHTQNLYFWKVITIIIIMHLLFMREIWSVILLIQLFKKKYFQGHLPHDMMFYYIYIYIYIYITYAYNKIVLLFYYCVFLI